MFKAVLLDLDGTLLNIDMDYFLKQYFGKMVELAAKMGFKEGNRLVDQVWRSTEVMIADLDPKSSNEEVFMRDFCQNWPYSLEEIKFFFERYYQEYFPRLKDFC
ncbi:MAG: HAD family hydrolase, partial [Syntrophomonadaceae bacterium]|nr:HAD family hydrolase [Syntrophomonadaceae bacterium]